MDETLTQAILARTSGSPCARLEAQACAYVDGELDGLRAELVRGHLDHCTACAALVAALEASRGLLPALAELDPGPAFPARVLAATTRKAAPEPVWLRVMRRPRIALELAYLGAAAALLLASLGGPFLSVAAPVRRAARRVTEAERRTFSALNEGLRFGRDRDGEAPNP